VVFFFALGKKGGRGVTALKLPEEALEIPGRNTSDSGYRSQLHRRKGGKKASAVPRVAGGGAA